LRNEFAQNLLELATKDSRILLIVGDLGYGVFDHYRNTLPFQYFNSGITEQSSVSYVAGLAKMGFRPFFYSIGNFPTLRALEQIRNDLSHMRLPATIVSVGAGFSYGTAGYSHHLVEDFSALSAFDVDIYTPTMPKEIVKTLNSILQSDRPSYLRLGKGGEENFDSRNHVYDLEDEFKSIPEARLNVLVNSSIIGEVVKAARILEEDGIRVNILSCWNMQIFDHERIQFLSSLENICVVEEHVTRGGFGSLIREKLESTSKKVNSIGLPKIDSKIVGSSAFLRESYGLDSKSLVSKFLRMINDK
jgi:transketolase